MSWHIPPSGTKLFCVLSVGLLRGENPVFSSPFHGGWGVGDEGVGGWKSSQAANFASSLPPFHPAKTGRLEFQKAVVPTTGEGPVGNLDPAHWAKGCSSTQALPKANQGRDRSLKTQVPRVIPGRPLDLVVLCI